MNLATVTPGLTAEHSCLVYEQDPDETLPVLVTFIREALDQQERFIYIADAHAAGQLEDRLRAHGLDVERETERGALKMWAQDQWRQPGRLDSAGKAGQLRDCINAARADGFNGVRFAVEMTWILDPDLNAEDLAHWEATIARIFVPGFAARIVCLYNRSRLSSDVVLAGLHTHPVAVIRNQPHDNWFCEAPLILNGQRKPGANAERVEWILGQLEKARALEGQRLELARTQSSLAEAERSRQAILATERRFRLVADTSPVLIWMSGAAGCDFINRTFIEFFGRPEGELLGLGWARFIHPDDYGPCLASYQRAAAAREEFSVEVRARRHDGQWRWLLTRGAPYFSPDGSFVGYVGTGTDIHDQKSAEQASQRLAAIIESSDDAIVGKDLNGIITSWNKGAERIFGYTAEEVIGRSITLLIPADRQQEEPVILERIRRNERVDHYETVRQRKDGTLLHISLTVSPIRSADGRIVGASKIARDITERVRREQALQDMQRELARLNAELEQRVRGRTAELAETVAELESFSYSITHDLRAPLRSMQSFATLLEQDCAERLGPVSKDYIRRIVTSARRMDRLIQDVLTYSRIARSELPLESIDLGALVQGIIESYPSFQAPGALVQVRAPLDKVLANEAALTQCLTNLIGNGIKFVPPGRRPELSIWTEPLEQRVRVCVQDNGIGVAERHQTRIFGIFQRLNKSYEGTGIGLSIVKKAAERMGGSVGLRSEPGKGSTFWLDLQPGEHR